MSIEHFFLFRFVYLFDPFLTTHVGCIYQLCASLAVATFSPPVFQPFDSKNVFLLLHSKYCCFVVRIGVTRGALPLRFLAFFVILYFERWYLKQNAAARLKSADLPRRKFLAGYATGVAWPQRCLYLWFRSCCSFLCNWRQIFFSFSGSNLLGTAYFPLFTYSTLCFDLFIWILSVFAYFLCLYV